MAIGRTDYDKPGTFPDTIQILGEIKQGKFIKTLKFDNVYDKENPTFEATFPYSFDFIYGNKIHGTVYVYLGGFYVEFTNPANSIYKSSHCPYFSMPSCRHYTEKGELTQFFIDRLMTEALRSKYEPIIDDGAETIMRYLNRKKGS